MTHDAKCAGSPNSTFKVYQEMAAAGISDLALGAAVQLQEEAKQKESETLASSGPDLATEESILQLPETRSKATCENARKFSEKLRILRHFAIFCRILTKSAQIWRKTLKNAKHL